MRKLGTLGDVLIGIEAGKSFQTTEAMARDNELGVLKVSAVSWTAFKPDEAKAVVGYAPEEQHRVRCGDLLISRANTKELVGAVVLVEKDYPFRLLSDKTLRLLIDPKRAEKSYLLYALRSGSARKHIEHFAAGTNESMRNIAQGVITSIPIMLPNIDEQKRIANALKLQLAAAEEARQAAHAQLRDLKSLAIRLNEETIAKLNSFKSVTLGELLEGIETGKSFQTSERIASVNELGVLKVSAISWGAFNPQAAKAIDGAYTPDKKHRVCRGDVIITRANTVELVGAVVRVERDYPNRLLSDKTLRLLLDPKRCDADYIVQVLRLPEARAHLEGNATGSSNSMRNISQGTLRATPIPLPSLQEQQQFSKKMLDVENALNEMRTTIQQQLCDIELLPSRLLAAVFDTPDAPSDGE